MLAEQKLSLLYEWFVDDFDSLKADFLSLIESPETVSDTHKFSLVLAEIKRTEFLRPVLSQISKAEKTDSWLSDYLYAAICLSEETSEDEEVDLPDNLVRNLSSWLLKTQGELAWKSATLLKFIDSNLAEEAQLQKLKQYGDFFLTYVECILGLLRFNKDKYGYLIQQIAGDKNRDEELRLFAQEVLEKRYS
jgi:hypothetical protein